MPQLAQVPVISTTVIFGEKPLARAPSISGWVTLAAATSPTAPQRSQIRNATELDGIVIVRAGEKRVAALDAMHEPLFHQEIERAIDGDRRRTRDVLRQFLDHIIGAERAMRRQQRLQHLAADRREALAALLAHRLRMRDRIRGAAGVIVARFVKDVAGRAGALRLFSH